jgi:glucose/mannose-6-phosphate isomerase
MLELNTIQKIDVSKMYEIYDKWPNIARKSFESEQSEVDFENAKQIVFAGMGGSGTIGDIFSSILSKSKIHVSVVKGYILPTTVDSDSLVILTSVSGNTDETMSILKSAHKLGTKIIAFSSGGKIEEYCLMNKIQHRVIPEYHSPRASLTSYLYSMLKVLHITLEIKYEDILESILELEKLSEKINSKNLTTSNPSLNLAKWITGIPIIYHPFGLQSASTRFKNALQENAKMHAFTEDIIEVCHNGVMAWEQNSSVQLIILEGVDDHFKTKERYRVLKEYYEKYNINFYEIFSINGNILSKLITLIYLFEYTTFYRAILSKIDPTPVKSIDMIKKRIMES